MENEKKAIKGSIDIESKSATLYYNDGTQTVYNNLSKRDLKSVSMLFDLIAK